MYNLYKWLKILSAKFEIVSCETMKNEKRPHFPVSDIYFSYQGEGIYLGCPTIFVRFWGCNLNCDYCDTPERKFPAGSNSPLAKNVKDVEKKIHSVITTHHKPLHISLTGGEPLLYSDFIFEFITRHKKIEPNQKIYLETNGTLPAEFKKVSKLVDIVSMDIKLASSCGRSFWKEHHSFLDIASASSNKLFVKVVITDKTKESEIQEAVNFIKKQIEIKNRGGRLSKKANQLIDIPVVLQPATPTRLPQRTGTVNPEKLFRMWQYAKGRLKTVYIIPQMHKLLWNLP